MFVECWQKKEVGLAVLWIQLLFPFLGLGLEVLQVGEVGGKYYV